MIEAAKSRTPAKRLIPRHGSTTINGDLIWRSKDSDVERLEVLVQAADKLLWVDDTRWEENRKEYERLRSEFPS